MNAKIAEIRSAVNNSRENVVAAVTDQMILENSNKQRSKTNHALESIETL